MEQNKVRRGLGSKYVCVLRMQGNKPCKYLEEEHIRQEFCVGIEVFEAEVC